MFGLNLPQVDLDYVLSQTSGWEELRGQRLLLTGGTGFIGKWLLGTFLHANRSFGLDAHVLVLSRNVAGFKAQHPSIDAVPEIEWLQGDIRHFELTPEQRCSYIIHAATDVAVSRPALEIFDSCVQGTRQVLHQMQRTNGRRMLLLSSGAVYGQIPSAPYRIPEEWGGAPDCLALASAYGEGKRASELLCAMAAAEYGLQISIARCFALVGPYLPFDKHFAIGNFIAAALQDQELQIQGDGTPLRSYLYAADLTVWLWTILFHGQSVRAYNVGGEESLSIADLAHRVVAALGSRSSVHLAQRAKSNSVIHKYVPDLQRVRHELGLREHTSLDQAIQSTAAWVNQKLI